MNEQDKKWLIEEFPSYFHQVLRGETKSAFIKAELLLKQTSTPPSCGCQARGYMDKVIGYYNEWVKENM